MRAYIANGHYATQTAITAGYNPNGAGVQGLRLLKDPYIAEEIAKVAERSCEAAGLGVALHAKPIVAAQAQVRIDHGDLTALLYLQGYSDDEFVRA